MLGKLKQRETAVVDGIKRRAESNDDGHKANRYRDLAAECNSRGGRK